MAADQRYCLECGERQVQSSDFLRSGPPREATPKAPPTPPGAMPPTATNGFAGPPRNNALTLLAGIGVLLIAMGVGVLIGRSGSSPSRPAAATTVVTVAGGGGSGGSGAGEEESFSDDWPSGVKGYTIQLQTLPQTGTTVAAVGTAKSAAESKGAGSVGALKSEDFSSLTSGDYVIYSGVYHKRAEAVKALGALKQKFPGAKVIEVAEQGSSASTSSSGGGSTNSSGSGSSLSKPAPASVLENEQHSKGKSYEEKSKNLLNVVSTA